MTKAALDSLTRSPATLPGPRGITVDSVADIVGFVASLAARRVPGRYLDATGGSLLIDA